MAGNYVQDGDVLTLVAPYARNAGEGAKIGSMFGVALNNVLISANGEFATEGVWDLAKTSAQAWSQGDKIYWDDTNHRCDNVSTVGMLIGVATAAAANPSATGRVALNEAVPEEKTGAQTAIANLAGTLTGTTTGTMADIAAAAGACAGGATPTATNVDTAIATAVALIVTDTNLQLKELQAKYNTLLAELRTAGILLP